ncbi:MAG TPA: BrnT family toxin [Elusimicrobiota bacterium]|nr:BrnT family toxin [Elusimicrobiota bacterium]
MYSVRSHGFEFAWDGAKNRANGRRHGVSFEEAATVIDDGHSLRYCDPEHSDDEERFLLVGMSSRFRVLFVSYCYRENETIIRIISARKANGQETKTYQRQRHDAGPL